MSETIEELDIEAQVIGWVVWRDGREPRRNGDGILFTDYAEALAARRLLDVVAPVTAARLAELAWPFDPGRGSGHN